MQLPVIPAFTAGESSVAHLQQLSAAVQFGAVAQYYPMWRFWKGASQAIAANTLTLIQFGSIAVDTDGVWTVGGAATINTQGYYRCEMCLPAEAGTTSTNDLQLSFMFTAGPNNPHLSSGSTQRFGGAATSMTSVAGPDFVQCTADICPVVCYPGDSIGAWIYSYYAVSTNVLTNLAATAGWFPPQFTGMWIRTGT
jgi:hypothetical protein